VRFSLLLAAACVTTRAAPEREFRAPTWPDTNETRAAIMCAVAKKYGSAVAVKANNYDVVVTEMTRYAGYTTNETSSRPTIVLNAGARSAMASAWRHEVFAHIVPHVVGFGWNRLHNHEQANQAAEDLEKRLRECRLAAVGRARRSGGA
jgi:hypothetical protein